ncbi:MAG: glycosyltransferase [Acidobacteriota bacterium]
MRYVLLTSACNEEATIARTLESVVGQTFRPGEWVIVDDGSGDRTASIVRRYAEKHDFIRLLSRDRPAGRNFASKVQALQAGREALEETDFDLLGILDADISLPLDYYRRITAKFCEQPRLGIAGGVVRAHDNPTGKLAFSSRHVRGAVQLFRRKCFEEIGGFLPLENGGEDAVASTMARIRGWEVICFPQPAAIHHRRTGAGSSSIWKGRFRQGSADYHIGYHLLYEVFKCVKRVAEPPCLAGSFLRLLGYCWCLAREQRPSVPPEVVRYFRKEQIQKLRSLLFPVPASPDRRVGPFLPDSAESDPRERQATSPRGRPAIAPGTAPPSPQPPIPWMGPIPTESSSRLSLETSMLSSVYYQVKPLIPRRIQLQLRRWRVSRQLPSYRRVWPIDPEAGTPPEGWKGWPGGRQFALVLTHDVESAKGQQKCRALASLEESLGFRSAFNFVPEGYTVDPDLRAELRDRGFEVGVHGLNHDGKLYSSHCVFQDRAKRINAYLKNWTAVGFRSPAMHHDLDWIRELHVEYDCSTFDTDPFEPQPDPAGTIFPFWGGGTSGTGGYVELPYTLCQDFTLFVLMRQKTISIWQQKLDWIAEKRGMALVNTHPDYMNLSSEPGSIEEYSVERYRDFLEYVKDAYEGSYWHALPREAAHYFRGQSQFTRPSGLRESESGSLERARQ